MAFKDVSITVRTRIRDAAFRLGKIASRVTVGSGPLDSGLGVEADTRCKDMLNALNSAGYAETLPDGTAKVPDGYSAGISIYSKSGDPLNSTIAAKVDVHAFQGVQFTSNQKAICTLGQAFDITTTSTSSTAVGRARVLVVDNRIKNLYLDNTAALKTGSTVPIQSGDSTIGSGYVTVTNNVVSSVKLPNNAVALLDGDSIQVSSDSDKTSTAKISISNGSLSKVTLQGTDAILSDGQTLSTENGVVTISVANGVATATYTPNN